MLQRCTLLGCRRCTARALCCTLARTTAILDVGLPSWLAYTWYNFLVFLGVFVRCLCDFDEWMQMLWRIIHNIPYDMRWFVSGFVS